MDGVVYRVLGTLAAEQADVSLPLGPPQQRALLALLLIDANQVVSIDRILDALWEDGQRPATAAKAVQVYVSNLRKQLGGAIATEPGGAGYSLAVDSGALDSERFTTLVRRGSDSLAADRAADARAELEQALELWHGEPFGELRFRAFVADAARELNELHLVALERHAEATLALGGDETLVARLEALAAEHPLRERLHRHLILALYQSGRQAEALDRYDLLRSTLRDELGLDPSPELQELQRAMLNQAPSVAPRPTRARVRVPLAPGPLIGRDEELDRLSALLHDPANRLVTLLGPGGVGKTRLAIAAAEREGPAFPGGAFFVDLSAAADEAGLLRAFARVLDLGGESDEVAGQIELDTLVVLDNFEQLVESAAVVERLLERAGGLRLLVTSRSPLRFRFEHRFPLQPLADDTDAVALFVDRARAIDPAFVVADEELPIVVEICRRLDGLPLAVELAAAATRVFTPVELLRDLDALGGGEAARDLPERQRTLRTTIDWSYRLLRPDAQRALRALATFATPFTLAAAGEVCGEPAGSHVATLLDQSLLAERRDPAGRERRFRMLQTIREFAVHELAAADEEDAVRERHFAHFADHAWRLRETMLGGGSEIEWMNEFRAAEDDMREAADWAVGRVPVERELRLLNPFCHYLVFSLQRRDARERLDGAIARTSERTPEFAAALRLVADIEFDRGDFQHAHALLVEARAVPGVDERFLLGVLLRLGGVLAKLGDDEQALALLNEVKESGQIFYVAAPLLSSADIHLRRGDMQEARTVATEALEVAEENNELWVRASASLIIAWAARAAGEDDEARRAAAAGLELLLAFPDGDRTPRALELAAALVLDDGAHDAAAELLACAAALRERLDISPEPFERELAEASRERLQGLNGAGSVLSAVDAIERARSLLATS